jgi:hypothetical protein
MAGFWRVAPAEDHGETAIMPPTITTVSFAEADNV